MTSRVSGPESTKTVRILQSGEVTSGKLQGQVAVITGGNGGLGQAIAHAFAKEKAHIVLAARNVETLIQVQKELEKYEIQTLAVPTDVSQESAVEDLFRKTLDTFGRVDILVNNAGISGPTCSVVDMDFAAWQETIDIDITGTFLCSRAALKAMIPAKQGNIINISSIYGKRPYPYRSPYAVAKWGMIGFTQTVAEEVGKHGVRVNCICPGPINGSRIERVWKTRAKVRGIPWEAIRDKMLRMAALRRIPEAEEVANLALFLASSDSSGMTGQAINLSCGTEMR